MTMSELESMNDKFSIKNLLFYRAIPNYEIPIPTDGYKVYACTDCCDRFILESSYERHINRKSLQITYMCRHCNNTKIFLNRCNLLSHIRSHAFKTATINVSDLKVEPLPLSYFKININSDSEVQVTSPNSSVETIAKGVCFDCKAEFFSSGPIFKERAKHYMRLSDGVFTCPICLFAMPNECGLKAHLRLHTNHPPFYCPECGQHLSTKTIKYPYTHHCEGFKMMRVTARMQCFVSTCNLLHPNDVKGHLSKEHVVKVFKCNACVVASYSNQTMIKHLKTHNVECKALIFYQCVLCPGRLVLPGQIEYHLLSHTTSECNKFVYVYPCWSCGLTCHDIYSFLKHHIEKHCNTETIKKIFESAASLFANTASKRVYRVVKRCDRCLRNFTYKCKYNEIQVLPDECPYKCTTEQPTSNLSAKRINAISIEKNIKCPCCMKSISENWEDIKKHFSKYHKNQRCVDIKIPLRRIKTKQNETKLKKKRNRQMKKSICSKQEQENNTNDLAGMSPASKINRYNCSMCDYAGKDKESFETHIINHRDPCMAYQCMECAKCFVVKPSFTTHMLLEHNVSDVDEYIDQKKCYNETALDKYQSNPEENLEPLRENQCQICRDQFENADDLEKHFRVHGMAFIMKKTSNKSP